VSVSLPGGSGGAPAARLVTGILLMAALWIAFAGPGIPGSWQGAAEGVANPGWEADADAGIALAARFNAALLAVLLATAGWWGRKMGPVAALSAAVDKPPLWFGWSLLGVTLLGVGLRVPLAGRSLWWDELWVVRQCSHGSWKEKADSGGGIARTFSPATWKRCAFYYQKPTNHVPMSLLQKASLHGWRKLTGAGREEFSELAIRLPALAGSALTIWLAGWLLAAWGARSGWALAGAALLALHPFALRHGVDARAYALVLPLALSALLAVTRLVESGGARWRQWVWLGLNQFVWLWAFPHGLLEVLALTLTLAVLLWRRNAGGAAGAQSLLRLAASHALAAALFVQAFLPCMLQASRWMEREAAGSGERPGWLIVKNTLAQVTTGARVDEWPAVWGGEGAGWLALGVLLGGMLAGIIALARRHPAALGLVALLVGAGSLVAATWWFHSFYYSRFAIATVPVAVLAWAGLGGMLRGRSAVLTGVLGCLLAAGYLSGARKWLTRPIEPVRDTAEMLRAKGGPGELLLAGYGHGREALAVYCPEMIGVTTADEVEELLRRARAEGLSLRVALGYRGFNAAIVGDGVRLLVESGRFRETAHLRAAQPEFDWRIYEPVE
jgi:hypothetical protein